MASPPRKPAPPRLPVLTVREVRFCRSLAEHGIASRAYQEAGYECDDKSEAAIRKAASRLHARPDLKALIAQMVGEAADAERVTVSRIAQGAAREAFAPRSRLFAADGTVLPPGQWPEELDALVTGVKVRTRTKDGVTTVEHEVRFAAPTAARRLLAEWRGMVGAKPDASADPKDARIVVGGESSPEAL